MAAYRRFISYIYAYRNGKKEKNAGFAKAEARGRSLKISIQMETAGNREGSLDAYGFLRKGEKLSGIFLGEMERSSGTQARLQYFLKVETDTENLMESGYALDQLSGLWIKGGPGENYITIWDEEPVTRMELEIEIQEEKDTADAENITEPELEKSEPEMARQEAPESEKAEQEAFKPETLESEKTEAEVFRPEAPESEKAEVEAFKQEVPSKQSVSEQSIRIESSAQMLTSDSEKPINGVRAQEAELLAGTEAEGKTEKEAEERPEKEEKEEKEKETVETITTEKETGEEQPPERYVRLWNRLTPAFAHRNPFLEGEALDAILITPRELHFFCCKNWSAARNSFIYHGYYNYHHLLFGKAIDGNFFLAVPGTYSGKEQQMAVSFGFPVFKESKEKVPGSCRGYWCRVL